VSRVNNSSCWKARSALHFMLVPNWWRNNPMIIKLTCGHLVAWCTIWRA